MSELKEGDEVYMIDCVLRRCKVCIGLDGNTSLITLDTEWDTQGIRTIAPYDEAIDLMKEKLNELKKGD